MASSETRGHPTRLAAGCVISLGSDRLIEIHRRAPQRIARDSLRAVVDVTGCSWGSFSMVRWALRKPRPKRSRGGQFSRSP